MAGLNMPVGLDYSQLIKDANSVDKRLTTLAGQERIMKITPFIENGKLDKDLMSSNKKVKTAASKLRDALSQLAKINPVMKEMFVNDKQINSMKKAQTAIRFINSELKKMEILNDKKEHIGWTDKDKANEYIRKLRTIKTWIDTIKNVSVGMGEYGFYDVNKAAISMKNARAQISKEMKALKAELAGTRPDDLVAREQILRRLISLQEKYNSQMRSVSKSAKAKLDELKAEQANIKALKQEQAVKERLSDVTDRIANLENKRNSTGKITSTIARLQLERSVVGQLITQWERYYKIAKKAGNGADMSKANAQLTSLRQQHVALRNLEAEERARMKAVNQNNALLNDQTKIFGKLWTAASRYISIFGIWRLGEKIIKTTGYFEQQQVALEGILGSAAKAEEALQRIKRMALQSPMTTYELVGYTKQLSAYNVGQGDPNQLLDIVDQLADLSTGLGVDMQRLILAYGQVNAASVLRGQELRQFTEAGIPMVQKLSEKFTDLNGELVTTGQVFEYISKRQVPFQMVADVLRDMTAEGGAFYQMQENVTDTLYGQVQKLKDLWTLGLDQVGRNMGSFLTGTVKLFQGLIKNIMPILKGATVFGIIKGVEKSFIAITLMAAKFEGSMRRASIETRWMVSRMKAATGFMAKMTVLAKAFSSPLGGFAFNGIMLAVSLLIGLFAKLRQETKEWKNQLANIDKSFARDTTKLISGLDSLIGKLRTAQTNSKDFADTIETLKANYGEFISTSMIDSLVEEAKQADIASRSWGALSDAIREAIIAKKEYERHDARQTAATDEIVKKLENKMKKLSDEVLTENTTIMATYNGLTGQTEYKDVYNDIGMQLKEKNAGQAFTSAIQEFLDSGLKNAVDLQPIIEKYALRYGFSPNTASALSSKYNDVYDKMTDTKQWKVYEEEVEYTANAIENIIDQRFKQAADNIANNYRTYTGTRDNKGSYNPFGANGYKNTQNIAAYRDLVEQILPSEQLSALKSRNDFKEAIAMSDSDEGKTLALSTAVKAFIETLKDPSLATVVQNMNKLNDEFVRIAGTNGVDPARIRTNMGKYYKFSNLTDDDKDYIKRFMPSDQNIDEQMKAIVAEYQTMEQFNKERREKGEGVTFSARIAENERKMGLLEILADPQYFNIAELKKKQGMGSRNMEFPDLFNYFSNAYALYKKATQEGGTSAGLAKFRTDDMLLNMYGDLFGVAGKQKDYGFKIGSQSVSSIIDNNRIKTGLEEGVVDFRAAAQAVADEMLRYGRANEKERGAFIRTGEQIQKWVTETFTKDAVATWLKEVKQSAEDLRNEFNRTRNDVELYRAMIANGTETRLAGNIGTSGILGKSLAPDSQLVMSQIAKVIANGNNGLKELAAQDPNKTYQAFSIGDISTLSGIKTVRQQINNEENMNSEAFTALREGLISKEELTKLLDELERALTSELQSIKGDRYSGNALQDAIANAKMAVNSQALQSAKDNINSFAKGFGLDEAAIKALTDKLNTGGTDVFEKFLRENDFSAISNAGRYFGGRGIDMQKLGKKLDDLINELKNTNPGLANEIKMKKDDFVMKELEFRAKGGAFDAVAKNTKRYQNAGEIATREFGSVQNMQISALSKKEALKGKKEQLERHGKTGTDEYAKVNTQLVEQEAILTRCRERLDEMGGSAEKYEQIIKQAAVANIKAAIDAASNSLTSMTNAATSVLNALKSLASMVNKMYDIFNDGENPEWMQDSEEILNDLGDAFEALIAPIAAVIAMLASCAVAAYALGIAFSPLLVVMLAIVAAAAVIAAIVVAAQQHDRNLEHDIESLKKSVTEFENSAKNLNAAAERMTGVDKMRTKVDALGKSLQSASAYSKMAEDEEANKDTDDEKLAEYNQSAQEAKDEFLNGLKEMVDDITASTESWADSLSSAIRGAFQNGENAALSFRDTVKTMIGDVVEEMIKMTIIEPLIQDALQTWTNSDALIAKYTSKGTGENGTDEFDSENYTKELLANIQDPQKTEEFYRSMLQIGTTTIDAINGLPTNLKDFYGYNSENSTLSGGIESITEDTALRIEALANSQLGELITIRTLLESYLSASKGYGNSTMASIQSAVTMINSNVGATKIATEAILKEIQQMRTTPANPLHVTMS